MIPIVYVCGIHKKKFMLAQGKSLLYYMCPNHRMEYRKSGDIICNNFVSRNIIREIGYDIEDKYEENTLEVNYEGVKKVDTWKYGEKIKILNVHYKVLDINEDCIIVGVINERRYKNKLCK